MALILAPDLYTNAAKTAIPGARADHRYMSLTTAQIVNGNIIALGILPANHKLTSLAIESDALDTGNTATVDVGILNTYYDQQQAGSSAQPAATYNSGGATDTGVVPALVSGQNVFTGDTIVRAGGRQGAATLAFTNAIGVDSKKDRIIAAKISASVGTAQAGKLGIVYTVDEA